MICQLLATWSIYFYILKTKRPHMSERKSICISSHELEQSTKSTTHYHYHQHPQTHTHTHYHPHPLASWPHRPTNSTTNTAMLRIPCQHVEKPSNPHQAFADLNPPLRRQCPCCRWESLREKKRELETKMNKRRRNEEK